MVFGRILKMHFGDGVIRKIFHIDTNPQTTFKRMWFRRRWKKFLDVRTKMTNDNATVGKDYVEVPEGAILGNPTEAVKKRFTLDCPSYDSSGNAIAEEDNIVTKLTREKIFLMAQLRNKDERIFRLEFELGQEARATRKDVVTETAADIEKIGRASASAYPARGGRVGKHQTMLSPDDLALMQQQPLEEEE